MQRARCQSSIVIEASAGAGVVLGHFQPHGVAALFERGSFRSGEQSGPQALATRNRGRGDGVEASFAAVAAGQHQAGAEQGARCFGTGHQQDAVVGADPVAQALTAEQVAGKAGLLQLLKFA